MPDRRNVYSTDEWMEQIGDVVHHRLKGGDDGTIIPGMDQRVTRLETHFEYVRRDLDSLKTGQDAILAQLGAVAADVASTKHSAAGKVTVISTGIAVVAVVLAVIAFGGDRFDGGMNASAIAEQAAAKAVASQAK